jgi:hypothetical protein
MRKSLHRKYEAILFPSRTRPGPRKLLNELHVTRGLWKPTSENSLAQHSGD